MNIKWDYKKIGDVCIVERGGSPRPIENFITDSSDGINWIKIGDTDDSMYITKTAQKIRPEGMKKSRYVQPGDFLLSNSMSFGRPYILKIDGCIHDGWLVLRDKENLFDKRFLYYYLSAETTYMKFKGMAVGGVVNNLNSEMVRKVTVPVPTKTEQSVIADRLDTVNTIISLRQQQLAKLDELVKARFVEMFGDVIHNDKKWKEYRFSDITSSRLGKMLDAKQQTGKHSFPYLANANVQWFRFETDNLNRMDFNEAEQVEFSLKDGDLLVCEGGEIGRCAVWHNQVQSCYFQKALHRVRCNQEIILPDYLAWWFKFNCENNGFAAIEGAKATIAHLPGAKLKQLLVVVPPIERQYRFVDFIEQTDVVKVTVQKSLEQMETLKKALMQQYFG